MEILTIILLVIVIALLVTLLFRKPAADVTLKETLKDYDERLLQSINNAAYNQNNSLADIKVAISESNRNMSDNINKNFADMIRKDSEAQKNSNNIISENIERMQGILETRMDSFKSEVSETLKNISGRLAETVKENAEGQKKINDNLSASLEKIHLLTQEKLSNIQKDVNDKLDASLNKRLDESFEKVTTQLSQLYKSLGELGKMSDGIANLNRTLTNVKTRGTWGEIQLGSILENTMEKTQYGRNIKLDKNSNEIIEFAIKIPAKENDNEVIYLPIDSKFPLDIYNKLVDASIKGSKEDVDNCAKELENRIKSEAKKISEKYILPPVTTDFAIMFLPTESLYAEVLRINGLAEFCQNECHIVISGPTTITALLNSLRVGFNNLALNKKTAEIGEILKAVKAQFNKFNELIDATAKKLNAAIKSTDDLKKRTGQIIKKMKDVGELNTTESDKTLMIEEISYGED